MGNKKFIQILLVQRNHWIAVSNVNCRDDTVYVYDSLYAIIDYKTQLKTCSLWRPTVNKVTFRMPNIQRQTNNKDCGVFAIAVAAELVLGRDPVECVWDVPVMRPHLKAALERGVIDLFPTIRRVVLHDIKEIQ